MLKHPRSIVQVRLSSADNARMAVAAARERQSVSAWLKTIMLRAVEAEESRRQALENERRHPGADKR